ncbi:MAG: hypothetical protein IJP46_11435 [Prevotella sp.]|nr:hypothetical protein [Prevotella sp.]
MGTIKNKYNHAIDLQKLHIHNMERKAFAQAIIDIEYRGYEVEQLGDGRKIAITKPSGKKAFGRPYKEDIQVFIFDPSDNSLWQISHDQIIEDVRAKVFEDKAQGTKLLEYLERTYNGEEPEDFIDVIRSLTFKTGEAPEALIKAYKWIWGQEDVNYPTQAGRALSWQSFQEMIDSL